MDMKLEVVVVPVADADKARDFYQAQGRVSGPAPDHQGAGT